MRAVVESMQGEFEIKVVGKSGQISLGKRYAGKALRLERRKDGTVVLTAVAMVPESQHWALAEPERSRIERGLTWAATAPAKATEVESLFRKGSKRALRAPARRS